ncbi:MAG: helix-turn-helix domain-containing protein [Sodaliphilus sp.]
MRKCLFALWMVIFVIPLCLCTSCGGSSEGGKTADSCYTIPYISQLCYTQPQRALELLDTAEQRHKLAPADINGMRALIYNNVFDMTNVALVYARKAYDAAKSDADSATMIKSIKMLTALSLEQSHYGEVMKYADEGIGIAKSKHDMEAMAYLLQFVALAKHETQSLDAALESLNRSNDLYSEIAEKHADWNSYDNYLYGLSQKANILIGERRYAEALQVIPLAEAVTQKLARCKDVPEGVADRRFAELYALYMTAYSEQKQMDKARTYFEKLNSTQWSKNPEGMKFVTPYLISQKQYDEALLQLNQEKRNIAASADTLTYYYVNTILYNERECYEQKGNLRKALEISKQMKVMTDTLYRREMNNNIDELSTLFKNKDMEMQLLMQEQQMARHRGIFVVAMIALVILGAFAGVLLYYNRKINRKNKIAAMMISELTEAHNKERMQTIAVPQPDDSEAADDMEKELFNRIVRIILEQKLFLQKGFGRDDAASLAKITPKHLSSLFQRFANGFPDYINTLRLEYSVSILKSKPNYTVEGISQECGFSSRQTYHRLFVEKYGMTPTEFRSRSTN